MKHELKCWPEFFQAIVSGEKKFEIRREDDRHFNVGDRLVLREYSTVVNQYSGRMWLGIVTYLVRGPNAGLPAGIVVMSLAEVQE